MRLALAAVLLLGCSWEGWPWTDPAVQLPLGGDRKCSDPVFGNAALQCCEDHDSSYWVGGTDQDRFTADAEFLACMALSGVPEDIATARYEAVRRFGRGSWNYTTQRTRWPAP